jgi:Methyltransferase domain
MRLRPGTALLSSPALDGPLTSRLRARPLSAHDRAYLGLAWPALEWLEQNVEPGMTTLETGSGSSTIVFAARGSRHVAISPMAEEHERIRAYCEQEGIDVANVRFIAESSETALARTWQPEPLDIVLIDGSHVFPFPVLDWYFTAAHLRVGGAVLVDDAYQPSVSILARYLRNSSAWRLETVLGYRTPLFRKVAEDYMPAAWDDFALGRVHFDYLPPGRRLVAWTRNRLLDRTAVGRFLVRHRPGPR